MSPSSAFSVTVSPCAGSPSFIGREPNEYMASVYSPGATMVNPSLVSRSSVIGS